MKCSSAAIHKMEAAKKRSVGNQGHGKAKRYSRLIYRVLRQGPQEPTICLSKESELILSIASEAARLALYNKRRTITRREVESAMVTIVSSRSST